ncbi:MAG: metal-dependent hydrolase [Deltaproteobacteria bacterium]|nr:metal-dependent hydrolase [Deltaproteobacteria bacterium]
MPTIFAHGAFGFTAAKLFRGMALKPQLLLAAIALTILPDTDALLLPLIPYRHPFGHRGFTHSLFFAACCGLATAGLLRRYEPSIPWPRLALFFALVTASHGFFDALTTGGLGAAFFAPFDNTRYFFPYRPIPVSPLSGRALLSARGWRVLGWELGLFWTFAAAAAVWERQTIWRVVLAGVCVLAGVLAWLLA